MPKIRIVIRKDTQPAVSIGSTVDWHGFFTIDPQTIESPIASETFSAPLPRTFLFVRIFLYCQKISLICLSILFLNVLLKKINIRFIASKNLEKVIISNFYENDVKNIGLICPKNDKTWTEIQCWRDMYSGEEIVSVYCTGIKQTHTKNSLPLVRRYR